LSKELTGKTALVTGASRGIGAATAVALAEHGAAKVIIHYGGYKEGAEEVLGKVKAAGAEGEIVQADLSTDAGIEQLASYVRGKGVDILINNAGSLVKRARLTEYTRELFDTVMNLNVKSVYFISQAVVPHMMERKCGHIVNIGSVAARFGGGLGATIYSGAKGAVSAITKGMARELAPHGIRVNSISPGTVDNHFHEQFSTKQMMEAMTAQTLIGRLGSNEELADAVVFLVTGASRYIYGQTIEVNGGSYMA
jgi:3-oxoacyl-[acyl-carrier protein] reductase